MAAEFGTTYLTVIYSPGDQYNNLPDDFVAMPPYTTLRGTARFILLCLRKEYDCPLPFCTTADLYQIARGCTERTMQRAIRQLVDAGYLHPLDAAEGR
jgi:hypothetical protein